MSLIDDAAAARKAGLTYGQYILTKPPVPLPQRPIGNGHYCVRCGWPLEGKQRKYCWKCRAKIRGRESNERKRNEAQNAAPSVP